MRTEARAGEYTSHCYSRSDRNMKDLKKREAVKGFDQEETEICSGCDVVINKRGKVKLILICLAA